MDRGIPGSTSHRGRLTLDVRDHGTSVVVSPCGELDHHTADLLREALEERVDEGRKWIVVDCSSLEFCDSTGLNVLLGARLKAEAEDGTVALADLSPLVARLFEITGAGTVFSVFDSVEQALSAQGEPSGR